MNGPASIEAQLMRESADRNEKDEHCTCMHTRVDRIDAPLDDNQKG
jgi:hypothetical protein